MMFEKWPNVYKRISQDFIIMTMIGASRVGFGLIEKKYDLARDCIPYTLGASSLALIFNRQFRNLENKINKLEAKYDSK